MASTERIPSYKIDLTSDSSKQRHIVIQFISYLDHLLMFGIESN